MGQCLQIAHFGWYCSMMMDLKLSIIMNETAPGQPSINLLSGPKIQTNCRSARRDKERSSMTSLRPELVSMNSKFASLRPLKVATSTNSMNPISSYCYQSLSTRAIIRSRCSCTRMLTNLKMTVRDFSPKKILTRIAAWLLKSPWTVLLGVLGRLASSAP